MSELGTLTGRVAGAPISWGVCEAPGWGHELAPDVVLGQMSALGLVATELGPTGYLGSDAAAVRTSLSAHGLRLVGGFLPVVLHGQPEVDLADAAAAIETLAAAGADVVVLAADAGPTGYDSRVELDASAWANLLHNLARVRALAARHGLSASLHPHVGTAIESRAAVLRLLAESDVPLCLDTGHLAIGGTDPVSLVKEAAGRVGHVHLKDVRMSVAKEVSEGTATFVDAVRRGLFAPLGGGDLDLAGVVIGLEQAGYSGWYVLEQDTALPAAPAQGAGPGEDVGRSLEFVRRTVVPALGEGLLP